MNLFSQFDSTFLIVVGSLLGIGLLRVIAQRVPLKKSEPEKTDKSIDYFNTYEQMDDWGSEVASQPEIVSTILKKRGYFSNELAKKYNIKKLSAVVSTLRSRGMKIEAVKRNNKTEGYKLSK